ncbi:hypothetical protein BLA_1005 [Bifidobacterium animalis subsp. lactis AD011]|uniref:Uncharacterized protein n=1 Tax=Bifidobacterium animalis subsp. lactis (strain AD011) TaxID=442563 RepID=B8DTG6_BIFA0|nr:hypothetical protein BLA_1005 [Bifidobacterium animalis subsp. lactis AD011]
MLDEARTSVGPHTCVFTFIWRLLDVAQAPH